MVKAKEVETAPQAPVLTAEQIEAIRAEAAGKGAVSSDSSISLPPIHPIAGSKPKDGLSGIRIPVDIMTQAGIPFVESVVDGNTVYTLPPNLAAIGEMREWSNPDEVDGKMVTRTVHGLFLTRVRALVIHGPLLKYKKEINKDGKPYSHVYGLYDDNSKSEGFKGMRKNLIVILDNDNKPISNVPLGLAGKDAVGPNFHRNLMEFYKEADKAWNEANGYPNKNWDEHHRAHYLIDFTFDGEYRKAPDGSGMKCGVCVGSYLKPTRENIYSIYVNSTVHPDLCVYWDNILEMYKGYGQWDDRSGKVKGEDGDSSDVFGNELTVDQLLDPEDGFHDLYAQKRNAIKCWQDVEALGWWIKTQWTTLGNVPAMQNAVRKEFQDYRDAYPRPSMNYGALIDAITDRCTSLGQDVSPLFGAFCVKSNLKASNIEELKLPELYRLLAVLSSTPKVLTNMTIEMEAEVNVVSGVDDIPF